MYDELWIGGKCMYKLEPVVADGGELIIYAPHISRDLASRTARCMLGGRLPLPRLLPQAVGPVQGHRRGACSRTRTHVRGIGTYENGVEQCRVQVTLASQIPEDICQQINLGYRDPATIDIETFANREDEGVLLVPKAGEMLYRLQNPPDWAVGS